MTTTTTTTAAAAVTAPASTTTSAVPTVPTRRPKGPTSLLKKRTGFQPQWLGKFALRVASVDPETANVLTLACRLCEKFGREKVTLAADGTPNTATTKRRRTTNVKVFKAPWRSDNIAHHARDQHEHRFAEYQALPTDKEKEAYLEGLVPATVHGNNGGVAVVVSMPLAVPAAPARGRRAAAGVDAALADVDVGVAPSVAVALAMAASLAPASVLPVLPTAAAAVVTPGERVVSLVDASIVETIVADVLLDVDSLVHDRAQALAVFSRPSTFPTAAAESYLVAVPNKLAFELCLQHVGSGASFRQCVHMVKEAHEQSPKGKSIGMISTASVINFVRFAAAMNFQVLASMLKSAWAFSIVFDGGSSKRQASFVDVRLRMALAHKNHQQIQDFHVLTLPANDRSSRPSLHVYETLAKLLTALNGDWQRKLVGIVSTCSPSVNSELSDVTSKLHQSSLEGCYRVWSGARQMELIVGNLFHQLFDDAFVDSLTAITGHLRCQDELIAAMQCECPRFVDTSWHAMGHLVDWFMAKRAVVKKHFESATPPCAPSAKWWVLMAALKRFTDIVNSTLSKIQGLTMQLGQQREFIDAMLVELVQVGYVRGPFENGLDGPEMETEDESFVFGQYYTTHHGAESMLEDLDPFVFDLLESLKTQDGDSYAALVTNIAYIFGESVSEFSKIVVAERSSEPAVLKLPSVLPHELVRLSGSELNRMLRTHQQRLTATYSSEEASAIHSEHTQMKTAYIRDASFKAQIDLMSSAWSFAKAWGSIGEVYPRLRNFVAGLATAYPDAVAVEIDEFAVLGYERSKNRSSLVDFPLEATLHCRQYPKLQEIASTMGL
ncbi:hypothetical protein Gpo141_00013583 [Globisporangium polare]